MFTVRRLGLSERLRRTLASTNPVESMISIARTTHRNAKRWRDARMVLRWGAAGMLNAERSFRRIKGHKDMPVLVAALARHVGKAHDGAALIAQLATGPSPSFHGGRASPIWPRSPCTCASRPSTGAASATRT